MPAMSYKIYSENKKGTGIKMPFAGMAIGDGLTDPVTQLDYSDFLYETGLVGANGKKDINELDKAVKKNIEAKNWKKASEVL